MAETARCRSCQAEIRWATLPDGKPMPLDANPVDGGNVAVHRHLSGVLYARVLKAGEEPEPHERRGVSHFATCSDAAAFRRRA
jgi:hypothetical protein